MKLAVYDANDELVWESLDLPELPLQTEFPPGRTPNFRPRFVHAGFTPESVQINGVSVDLPASLPPMPPRGRLTLVQAGWTWVLVEARW